MTKGARKSFGLSVDNIMTNEERDKGRKTRSKVTYKEKTLIDYGIPRTGSTVSAKRKDSHLEGESSKKRRSDSTTESVTGDQSESRQSAEEESSETGGIVDTPKPFKMQKIPGNDLRNEHIKESLQLYGTVLVELTGAGQDLASSSGLKDLLTSAPDPTLNIANLQTVQEVLEYTIGCIKFWREMCTRIAASKQQEIIKEKVITQLEKQLLTAKEPGDILNVVKKETHRLTLLIHELLDRELNLRTELEGFNRRVQLEVDREAKNLKQRSTNSGINGRKKRCSGNKMFNTVKELNLN